MKICSRAGEGRRNTEENAGEDRDQEHERQRRPIQPNDSQHREVSRVPGADEFDSAPGQSQSGGATHRGQQNALGK